MKFLNNHKSFIFYMALVLVVLVIWNVTKLSCSLPLSLEGHIFIIIILSFVGGVTVYMIGKRLLDDKPNEYDRENGDDND